MSARPDFLRQTKEQQQRDRELQTELRATADARGLVKSKDDRRRDFLARSIVATEQALRETDNAGRAGLKGRLAQLRSELSRLTD